MKSLTLGLTVLSASILTGCANGPLEHVASTNSPSSINYETVGIPLLLGGFGSSVPLTKDLSLTAAHVAKYNWKSVVSYNPKCDIAIIKSNNSEDKLPTLGTVYTNEPVYSYGEGIFGYTLKGTGKYRLDLNFKNTKYSDCEVSISDTPIQHGMSGGGFYNSKGELVGIISSIASDVKLADGSELPYKRLSVFISVNGVKGWINKTVQDYAENHNVKENINWNL